MKYLLALGMLALVIIAPVANATDPEPMKVIVCKYVGTPGVDEVLQTGDNPIQVSDNAIPGFTGTFPYEFADAQGRSLAVRFAASVEDRGTLSDCPPPTPPPPPFDQCPDIPGNQPAGTDCDEGDPRGVATAAAVCDITQQTYNVTGEVDGVVANVSPTTIPGNHAGLSLITVWLFVGEESLVLVSTDGLCFTSPPPPPPPGERCPPGMVPTDGKDGESGNDECEFPPGPPPPPVTPPPTTPVTPTVTTPTPTPTVTPPKPTTKPKPKPVRKPAAKPKPKPKPKAKPKPKPKAKSTVCKPGYRYTKQYGCTFIAKGSG